MHVLVSLIIFFELLRAMVQAGGDPPSIPRYVTVHECWAWLSGAYKGKLEVYSGT